MLSFWNVRNDLYLIDNLVFKNNALVIPTSLHKLVLSKIHEGHHRINFSMRKAKDVDFWPGMNAQIKAMVTNCMTCAVYQKANSKQEIVFHEIPELPWYKVGTDLFEYNKKYYLLVVDYWSKFIEISLLPDMTFSTAITHLKSIFSRHGIPEIVIFDGGRCLLFKQ